MMQFGVVVVETIIKNGNEAGRIEKARESVHIASKQEMLDHIFKQLDLLKTVDQVDFSIFNDKHSKEPNRMEITTIVKH